MPAKCPFCETNTHNDSDIDKYPVCSRNFLTKNEAWTIIGDNKKDSYHVMRNPKENVLIGIDWTRKSVKEFIECSEYIERCDPDGKAREMGHGLAVMYNGFHYFVETQEDALKAYEELYCEK